MYRTQLKTKVKASFKLLPETRKYEQNVSQFQITSLNPVSSDKVWTFFEHYKTRSNENDRPTDPSAESTLDQL